MESEYDIFDLLVERNGSGYRARVLSPPNATADLGQPISEDQLQSFLFRVGRPRRLTRRIGPSITEETKSFGSELLKFLFPDRIWDCLERSKLAAHDRHRGLRIQIRLSDVPELCDLPWEFLYHDDDGFLALSAQTPITRFLDTRQYNAPLNLQHPLRILAVISSPRDLPRLNVDLEWGKLDEAVSDLKAKGLVELARLETPRLSRLNRRLGMKNFHILHFVGHGDFNDEKSVGELYFEDEQGRASPVSADQLATALRDHPSVRLVILNACEGARASRTDPFAGSAQTLIRAGIPAVIAMQFEVTDDAAITLASELYTSIAIGDPIDRSLTEARKAIYLDGNELEWATPVLYLRTPDSRIFAVPHTRDVEEERAGHAARPAADSIQSAREGSKADEPVHMAEAKPIAEEGILPAEAEEAARIAKEKQTADEAARRAERKREAGEAERQSQGPRRSDVELVPLTEAKQVNGRQSTLQKRSINSKNIMYVGAAIIFIVCSLFVAYEFVLPGYDVRSAGLYTITTYPAGTKILSESMLIRVPGKTDSDTPMDLAQVLGFCFERTTSPVRPLKTSDLRRCSGSDGVEGKK